jgi:hypothetical protein
VVVDLVPGARWRLTPPPSGKDRSLGVPKLFGIAVVVFGLEAHVPTPEPSNLTEGVTVGPPDRIIDSQRSIGMDRQKGLSVDRSFPVEHPAHRCTRGRS